MNSRNRQSIFKEVIIGSLIGSMAGHMLSEIFKGQINSELLETWKQIINEQKDLYKKELGVKINKPKDDITDDKK